MKRFELIAAATGVVIAALLTWSAYYSNSHNGALKISELVFSYYFRRPWV
jgi:hypothetical protein